MTAATSPTSRYTRARPCPICGGWESMPRGQGTRCDGYLFGEGAYCARRTDGKRHPSADLYWHRLRDAANPPGRASAPAPRARIVATYDYCDENGALVYQVVRKEPKAFLQRRPDGRGGWTWGLGGIETTLYRLPELLQAVAAEDPVFIVEGEKDADALHRAGCVATCNSGGAGKWRPHLSERLRGVSDARIVADRDAPGYRHAAQVAASLRSVGASVRVFEAAQGKDVSDHLAAGCSLEELIEIDLEERMRATADNARPAAEAATKAPPLTDLGNAERFVCQHGAGLRYCPELRGWLRWDAVRWERVEAVHLDPLARDTVRSILAEAQAEEDGERRALIAKHAARSESESRVRAMVGLATAVPGVIVRRDALDADPNILNTLNGTLHLDTGELRAHRRADLLTRIAPVRYEPEARSEAWERVLEHALPEADLREFFARAVGYSLGGPVTHDAVFFVHGPTNAAKSTLIGAIEATLGDYAASCEFSTFLRRDGVGGTQPGLAKLPGVRVAVCHEVEPGRAFNVGLLKAFSAGDTVTCHAKYEAPFTFRPEARLWLVANDRPEVNHTDSAVWRRLHVIPFAVPVDAPDETLKGRLRDPAQHGAAILAWAMRGRADWIARGRKLDPPAAVVAEGLAYRASQNPLGAFVADCCRLSAYAWTATAVLQDAFGKWSGSGKPLPDRQFAEALRALGCESAKRAHRRGWSGIELVEEGRE